TASNQPKLGRRQTITAKAPTASNAVSASTTAVVPRSQVTAAMSPTAAAFTPSSAAAVHGERRSTGTSQPNAATVRNDGRKIANVAVTPPQNPATRYPTNVAVVNTGPGVTWPTDTASTNWRAVSQCRWSTRSRCRNAKST